MPKMKILIGINYNQSESRNGAVSENETNDYSEWNVKRIMVALTVLLSIAGALVYFWSSSAKTVHNVQDAVAISQKSSKQKPPNETGRPPSSDSLFQQQKPIPNDGNTQVVQDLKKPANRQGKPISAPSVAKERKTPIGAKNVTRSRFTSGIEGKEPVDNLSPPFFALRNEAYSIYFFTELKRLKGHIVTHVWKHKGQIKLKKEFEVRGNRWRVYTSKLLNMAMLGPWNVAVVDSDGRILMQKGFELKAPLE